jgi:hypothetical protein
LIGVCVTKKKDIKPIMHYNTMIAESIYAKNNNIEFTMLELIIMKLSLNNLFSQIINFDLMTLDG